MRVLKLILFFALSTFLFAALPKSECVTCHEKVTPGIVKQHLSGKMGQSTVMPVDCSTCHGTKHHTMEDSAKATLPTPATCAQCHQTQVDQYKAGKHNLAWFAMKTQAAWHGQPAALVKQGYRGCSGCHKMGQKGFIGATKGHMDAKLKYDGGKEASEYHYGNGQCDACHTRHKFSKAEAQDSRACSNCHMGFDHPQWEMYTSSKHGIIWAIDGHQSDGRAPTCQKCHMPNGDHNVVTAWGFLGLRMPIKENVLALIKVAPSLKKQLTSLAAALPSGHYDGVDDDPGWTYDRALIAQVAEVLDENFQPTPLFTEIAIQARAMRGPKGFNRERAKMKKTCMECHAGKYVDDFFHHADMTIKHADHQFAKAIAVVQGLAKDGILKKPKGWKHWPSVGQYYDNMTSIELDLYLIWMEYRQRTFQGAFHVSNDYSHWYGWAPLKETVHRIMEEGKRMRAEHEASKKAAPVNTKVAPKKEAS